MARARRRQRPHLFDIVEATDFRAEDVDDDVAAIDQHPVASRQAFDLGLTVTGVFQRAHDVVGQGADVTVRTARRDDQRVGDRGLAFEVDADDVLGLVVVETVDDQGLQRVVFAIGEGRDTAVKRIGSGLFENRSSVGRVVRGLQRQGQGSFSATGKEGP